MNNYIDIIIIILIAVGFIAGFRDGLIKKVFSLAGLIIGIFLAITFSSKFSEFIVSIFNIDSSLGIVVSFILIIILTSIAAKLISNILKPRDTVLNLTNRILGGGLGILQTALIISALLIFLSYFNLPAKEERQKSKLYELSYSFLPSTFEIIKKVFPSANKFFDSIEQIKKTADSILS
ncbi:MAG: CvpA family protein [Ignavibacteria bacterium]|nr:CvpA family protein [Ignavibacteria bacterium]